MTTCDCEYHLGCAYSDSDYHSWYRMTIIIAPYSAYELYLIKFCFLAIHSYWFSRSNWSTYWYYCWSCYCLLCYCGNLHYSSNLYMLLSGSGYWSCSCKSLDYKHYKYNVWIVFLFFWSVINLIYSYILFLSCLICKFYQFLKNKCSFFSCLLFPFKSWSFFHIK